MTPKVWIGINISALQKSISWWMKKVCDHIITNFPNIPIVHVWGTTFQRKNLCITYLEVSLNVVNGISMKNERTHITSMLLNMYEIINKLTNDVREVRHEIICIIRTNQFFTSMCKRKTRLGNLIFIKWKDIYKCLVQIFNRFYFIGIFFLLEVFLVDLLSENSFIILIFNEFQEFFGHQEWLFLGL